MEAEIRIAALGDQVHYRELERMDKKGELRSTTGLVCSLASKSNIGFSRFTEMEEE